MRMRSREKVCSGAAGAPPAASSAAARHRANAGQQRPAALACPSMPKAAMVRMLEMASEAVWLAEANVSSSLVELAMMTWQEARWRAESGE